MAEYGSTGIITLIEPVCKFGKILNLIKHFLNDFK